MQTQKAQFPENKVFFVCVDLNKLSSVSLPEILFPSAHLWAVTQGTLTRYKTSRTRTERRRGQSADTCPGWPRPLPPQSSNQLSGLPAIGQWSYTEGQSQLTQTPNPVGALTSPCQSGVELMRVVLCFRHHMDASHGATAVTGQLNYESDQSQPKYINQTWNQVHISIRNRKTFTQHEWCIHKTESQSDPNGLNTSECFPQCVWLSIFLKTMSEINSLLQKQFGLLSPESSRRMWNTEKLTSMQSALFCDLCLPS